MTTSNLETLREELKSTLEKDAPDFGLIIELANKLSRFDQKNLRFGANASLISRLGLQLVSRQETAVSEIVKNAYDADATNVTLVFSQDSNKPGGKLVITDNGNGMSRDQLIDGFMRLASSDKTENPTSPKFLRRRAGSKGLGRFAVQRLGRSLTLVTQTADSKVALKVTIDWDTFEQDKDLFSISSRVESIDKEQASGTKLIIGGLREAWTDNQISRVYRFIEELVQPSFDPADAKPKDDEGPFHVTFSRIEGSRQVSIASEEKMVFDHALAKVTGKVDKLGRGSWRAVSKKLDFDETSFIAPDSEDPDGRFEYLSGIEFSALYFIYSSEYIPGQDLARIRQIAERSSGVRLYRNGFRVLPYGESQDDWLRLDYVYRRRTILIPLANSNWFGYVTITDHSGIHFEETSSREGLRNNDAYQELVAFVSESLIAAALRIGSVRGRKATAKQKDFTPRQDSDVSGSINSVAEKIERLAEALSDSPTEASENKEVAVSMTKVAQELRQTANLTEEKLVEKLEENDMLRVLASLGLTIGIFTHEVRLRLVDMKNAIQWLSDESLSPDSREYLDELVSHFNILQAYTAYFDATIAANVSRERSLSDLSWVLYDFVREFTPIAERDHIVFYDVEIEPDLYGPAFHVSEWASILTNLFTNSRKAIRRTKIAGGRISLRAYIKGTTIVIDFLDTGDGIPLENRDRVFDAFFTTTHSTNATLDADPIGSGLGLKIVHDIVSSSGGEIYIATPPDSYSTCIRIELPLANE